MTIALIVLAVVVMAAVVVAIARHFYPYILTRPGHIAPGARFTTRADKKQIPGCTSGRFCQGRRERHGPCTTCGEITCSRGGWIEPDTLRRRTGFQCSYTAGGEAHRRSRAEQDMLAGKRRRADLEKITVPANDDRVSYSEMPDQYPGPVRDSIRAMRDSDATEAVVEGISASTLNGSLNATGLSDEMYAEQRDGKTVLRKKVSL